jgi:hypothetical protein
MGVALALPRSKGDAMDKASKYKGIATVICGIASDVKGRACSIYTDDRNYPR